jgi:uncharacterized protein YuzE
LANGKLRFKSKKGKGGSGLESIVLKPGRLDVRYDKGSDVLYISTGKPKEADDSVEPQEGVVIRTRKGQLVGITIIGLEKHLTSNR